MKNEIIGIFICLICVSDVFAVSYADTEDETSGGGMGSYITSSIVETLNSLFGGESGSENSTYSASPTLPSSEYTGSNGDSYDATNDFSFTVEDNTSSLLGAEYTLSDYSYESIDLGGTNYILYTGGMYSEGDIITIGGTQCQLVTMSTYQSNGGDTNLDFGSYGNYLLVIDMAGNIVTTLGSTPSLFKMPISGGEYFFIFLLLGYGVFVFYRYRRKKIIE